MRITILSVAILSLALAACDSGGGGGPGWGEDTGPVEDTAAPPEDTLEPPPEDTLEPPPEDTLEPPEDSLEPPEDSLEPPPEDTLVPPPEDTLEPPEDTLDPPPEDTLKPAGACDNPADLAVLAENADTLSGIIGDCVFPCFGQGEACMTGCVQDATGLSDGCAGCFGAIMQCTVTNCAFQCIDSGSQACKDCQAGKCAPAFLECAGVPMM